MPSEDETRQRGACSDPLPDAHCHVHGRCSPSRESLSQGPLALSSINHTAAAQTVSLTTPNTSNTFALIHDAKLSGARHHNTVPTNSSTSASLASWMRT